MPERKKPASSRREPSGGALRKPPRRATALGGAVRRSPAEPRKKATPARKPSLRRRAAKPVEPVQPEQDAALEEAAEETAPPAEVRPVAIAGQTPPSEAPAAAFGETAFPGAPGLLPERVDGEPGVLPLESDRADRYPQDGIVAALSLLLAGSVFLPWYNLGFSAPLKKTVGLSGWESGWWGPIVVFLALGSFALALSRLVGKHISLPLPHPTIHEAVGWIAIFAVLLKRLRAPKPEAGSGFFGVIGQTWWILVPIVLGLVLAFLAGRMTSGPPLVVLPGWQRGRAGKVGIALLAVVLIGGAGFGYLYGKNLDDALADKQTLATGRRPAGSGSTGPGTAFQPLKGKYPKCAADVPKPSDAKPETGVEQTANTPCIWVMNSEQKPDAVLNFYKAELPKSGYTFSVAQVNAAGSTLTFAGKKCGNISISPALQGQKGSRVAVYLAPCPKGGASPRPTGSPSK